MKNACIHIFIPLMVLAVLLVNLNLSRGRALDNETNLTDDEDDSGEESTRKKDDGIMGYIGKKKDKLVDKLKKKKDDIVDEISNKTQAGVDLVQSTISDVYKKVLEKKLNYTDKLKFLAKNSLGFGGLEKILKTNATVDSLTDPIVKKAVKLFQKVHDLNVSGVIDDFTELKMLSPRCGHSDFSREFDLNENKTNEKPDKPKMAEFKAVARWNRTNLRYKFLKYNDERELGRENTKKEVRIAFSYWAEVSPLTFEEVCEKCPSDFVISFDTFEHGDGATFDGPGGVLAHAFYPSDGRIHFDDSEIFTKDSKEGINLRLVAAHELGHALGLDHSYAPGALMNPYYSGYIQDFKLPEDDVMGIQALYGRKSSSKITTKAASPTKTTAKTTTAALSTSKKTTTMPRHYMCNEEYDAVFTNSKNDLFVLHDYENLWKFDMKNKSWIKQDLWSTYRGIEDGVRGGVVDKNKVTWFFKGRFVFAFAPNNSLMQYYPKFVRNPVYPVNPYAAVYKNNQIYLLKGRFAYKFDPATLNVVDDNIEMVEDVLPGVPTSVKAAVKIGDFYYMFKDKIIYKFDLKANKVVETGGSWAACQPSNLNGTAQITKPKQVTKTTLKTTTITTTTPKPETTKKKKWYHKLLD